MWSFYFSHVRSTFPFWDTSKFSLVSDLGGGVSAIRYLPAIRCTTVWKPYHVRWTYCTNHDLWLDLCGKSHNMWVDLIAEGMTCDLTFVPWTMTCEMTLVRIIRTCEMISSPCHNLRNDCCGNCHDMRDDLIAGVIPCEAILLQESWLVIWSDWNRHEPKVVCSGMEWNGKGGEWLWPSRATLCKTGHYEMHFWMKNQL
jgi:hypothetical protein